MRLIDQLLRVSVVSPFRLHGRARDCEAPDIGGVPPRRFARLRPLERRRPTSTLPVVVVAYVVQSVYYFLAYVHRDVSPASMASDVILLRIQKHFRGLRGGPRRQENATASAGLRRLRRRQPTPRQAEPAGRRVGGGNYDCRSRLLPRHSHRFQTVDSLQAAVPLRGLRPLRGSAPLQLLFPTDVCYFGAEIPRLPVSLSR